ncbi:MAG: EAL domain-containing protein [Elainellaceae cyanobacterium]
MRLNRASKRIKFWLVQPPLRLLIVAPFLLQIFAAVGVTGWLSWRNGQAAIHDVMAQLVDETSDRISQQLHVYAKEPRRLNQTNIRAAQLGLLDLSDVDKTVQYFMQQLMLYEAVTFIGFGSEAGEFISVNRLPNDQFQSRVATLATNQVLEDHLLSEDGDRVRLLKAEPDYDVRQRPWYKMARSADGPTWGSIHPYFASEGLVLAINEPLYSPVRGLVGVIGVGYDLSFASQFLADLSIGEEGDIFIIKRTGDLVASSMDQAPSREDGASSGPQRLSIFDSDRPTVRLAAERLLEQFGSLEAIDSPVQMVIRDQGQQRFIHVTPFEDGYGIDWLTVVVVPESSFTEQMQMNTRTTVLLCLVALAIASGSGIVTARYITRPLLALNKAAKQIAQGDLQQSVIVGSSREVNELARAFNQMAIQLKGSFDQLQAANAALSESEHRLHAFLDALPMGVVVIDLAGQPTYLNRAGKQLLGLGPDDAWPDTIVELFQIYQDDTKQAYSEAELPGLRALKGEVVHLKDLELRRQQQRIPLEAWATPIRDDRGQVIYSITAFQDISDRKRAEQQLFHDALHDALTGLPNRHMFMERLKTFIHQAEQVEDYQFAVLFIDLDQFKLINDSFGHLIGDLVLFSVAQKLQAVVRAKDVVARFGGDEFVILLDAVETVQDAVHIAERISIEFATPPLNLACSIALTASIGIVMGRTYSDGVALLRDADIALYRAKAEGRARYKIFDATMGGHAIALMTLENSLRRGIAHQEFMLYYQPIVSLASRRLQGFEALARWQTPAGDLILPKDFIAAAENSGLIVDIDFNLIRTACRQLVAWQGQYPHAADLKISVNLSVHDIRSPHLIDHVVRALEESNLSGEQLTLEITESVLLNLCDFERLLPLKEKGIQISIDDFGTGYSSLSYLCWLPVDMIKVDQSFVRQMQIKNRSQVIVQTIVSLGQQLSLETTAEGIETSDQLELLRQLGCRLGQGHLFSKALSTEAVEALLSNPQADGSILL